MEQTKAKMKMSPNAISPSRVRTATDSPFLVLFHKSGCQYCSSIFYFTTLHPFSLNNDKIRGTSADKSNAPSGGG